MNRLCLVRQCVRVLNTGELSVEEGMGMGKGVKSTSRGDVGDKIPKLE